MILRAIFWIGVVSVLIPHEPDLGFGRPVSTALSDAPNSITSLIQTTGDVKSACDAHKQACAGGLSILDGLQGFAMRSMDQVRADIAANRRRQ
jgi:hypothetical protein